VGNTVFANAKIQCEESISCKQKHDSLLKADSQLRQILKLKNRCKATKLEKRANGGSPDLAYSNQFRKRIFAGVFLYLRS